MKAAISKLRKEPALVECTQDSYLRYSKSKLNEAYLHEKMKQAIIDVMEGVNW